MLASDVVSVSLRCLIPRSGVSVLSSKIQYRSLSFLRFLLLLRSSIFSIPITLRSSWEWFGWLKCAATGLSASFFVVMSDRWPFILICRAFSVSPTYCMLHLSQLIMYTMFFVLHVNWFLMVYLLPVVLLVKVLVRFISWQVLRRLLPHGALSPGLGGVAVFTSRRSRRCGMDKYTVQLGKASL